MERKKDCGELGFHGRASSAAKLQSNQTSWQMNNAHDRRADEEGREEAVARTDEGAQGEFDRGPRDLELFGGHRD